jgi:hypothetical protein
MWYEYGLIGMAVITMIGPKGLRALLGIFKTKTTIVDIQDIAK